MDHRELIDFRCRHGLDPAPPPSVDVEDLADRSDHTLLYGYDVDRNTHHVYLKDRVLHKVVHRGNDLISHQTGPLLVRECIPNKRVYPAATDLEFCELLLMRDPSLTVGDLHFSEWEQRQYDAIQTEGRVYGKTVEQLEARREEVCAATL